MSRTTKKPRRVTDAIPDAIIDEILADASPDECGTWADAHKHVAPEDIYAHKCVLLARSLRAERRARARDDVRKASDPEPLSDEYFRHMADGESWGMDNEQDLRILLRDVAVAALEWAAKSECNGCQVDAPLHTDPDLGEYHEVFVDGKWSDGGYRHSCCCIASDIRAKAAEIRGGNP